MIESERKFLFVGDIDDVLSRCSTHTLITQHYLLNENGQTVRVRQSVDQRITGTVTESVGIPYYRFAYKMRLNDSDCVEVEVDITGKEYDILVGRSMGSIEKTRYILADEGRVTWTLDKFNTGLKAGQYLIEGEANAGVEEVTDTDVLKICGKEVTHLKEWKNAFMVQNVSD